MKKITKILITVLTIFLNQGVYAQDTTFQWPKDFPQPKPGGYGKNMNLQKFVGTWKWQSGDTVFIITLEKFISKVKTGGLKGYTFDAIIGWHELRVGNKVIESSLRFEGGKEEDGTFTILGGHIQDVDKLTITGFIDLSKSKSGCATLEFLSGEKDKAQWILKGTPGVKILDVGQVPDYTFTVPTNVIMERIKNKNK